jgi:malate dehydrogenase (oxaloacetate-decarboxylating)
MILAEDIAAMAKDPIVFALSNPVPEIMPDVAKKAGVAVIATGRSDFANQVNNSLAFPGIFRGALDSGVRQISDKHKIAAAEVIAGLVATPSADKVIPGPFTPGLTQAVAAVIT